MSSSLELRVFSPGGCNCYPRFDYVRLVADCDRAAHYCRNCFTIFFCDAINCSICGWEYFLSAFSRCKVTVLLAQSSI